MTDRRAHAKYGSDLFYYPLVLERIVISMRDVLKFVIIFFRASRDDRSFFLSNSRNEKSAEILPNRERTTNEKHTLKEESPK